MLIAEKSDKVFLTIMITDDLVDKGLNASIMIREVSKEVNGGGGGQSFFATAGGSDSSGISSAIEKLKQLI
jgi:alanyl-tRNA synthetase